MTEQLKQAAQQALEAYDAFADADDFSTLFELNRKMNVLRDLTQRPAAQAGEVAGKHIAWLHDTLRDAGYCIDGGKCHHLCKSGPCFRQNGCVPLSGSGLSDDWKLPTQPAAQATPEPTLRFCPGCGSVGDVPDTYRDCCPDGANARLIPESLAHRCHALFRLALDVATGVAGAQSIGLGQRDVITTSDVHQRVSMPTPEAEEEDSDLVNIGRSSTKHDAKPATHASPHTPASIAFCGDPEATTLQGRDGQSTKQAATPEPAGEPVAWRYKVPTHGGGTAWTHMRPQPECLIEAQPLYTHPAPGVPDVDTLAQFIRQIDGNHSMGAGALAERICEWLAAAQAK